MCIPLAVGAALLTGAGGLAKYFGEKKAQNAQRRAELAERQRQQRMTEEQQAYLDDSLAGAGETADPAKIAAAKAARENTLIGAMMPAESQANFLPGQSSAPAVVQQQEARSVDKSAGEARSLASALAALGATGDQMQALNIRIGRNSQGIGQVARDKANSADILQTELQAAAEKGAFLRGLGGLAQQIGMAMATGGGGPAASGASTGMGLGPGAAKLRSIFVPAAKAAAAPAGVY
jgi:hypothetical protein